MVSSIRDRFSWMLPVLAGALLVACGGGGGGGDGGTGGTGGSGGASCDAMHDDAALSEAIDITLTNDRSEAVYLSYQGCSINGWAVDGQSLFDPAPPTCEGLLVGEPGVDQCAPTFDELAPGASIHVPWKGRTVESIPVVAGCPDPPDDSASCSRFALTPDGTHELTVEVFEQVDPGSGAPSSPFTVTTSFDLPATSIAVSIAPAP